MNEHNEELNQAVRKKLEEMESPDYVFPPAFTKKDYVVCAVVMAVCALGLLLGYLQL